MLTRRITAILITILAFTSYAMAAMAQGKTKECPYKTTFGIHPRYSVKKNLEVQLDITYFATADANAFISEREGLSRSASYMKAATDDFTAKLDLLERDGLASIKKQEQTTSFMGEVAQVGLERNLDGTVTRLNHAGPASMPDYIMTLDRQTEVSVVETPLTGAAHYQVGLISALIKANGNSAEKIVDLDATVFLAPGQTAIFKLAGEDEVRRSGQDGRSYVAVTMRAVENAR